MVIAASIPIVLVVLFVHSFIYILRVCVFVVAVLLFYVFVCVCVFVGWLVVCLLVHLEAVSDLHETRVTTVLDRQIVRLVQNVCSQLFIICLEALVQ